jgi:hypothetical protein
MGLAAALCRWICGAATDRLISLRIVPGDWGALGLLAGVFLAGYLTEDKQFPHLPPVLRWVVDAVMKAPAWLLFLCVVGGSVVVALGEAGVRRALRRPVVPAGEAPTAENKPLPGDGVNGSPVEQPAPPNENQGSVPDAGGLP